MIGIRTLTIGSLMLTAAAMAAPPLPQPPQPPADEIVHSAQAIQKKLIDNCMAKPDCRASLLSDDSYANGKMPPYNPATAAHSWEEVRRGAGPGG